MFLPNQTNWLQIHRPDEWATDQRRMYGRNHLNRIGGVVKICTMLGALQLFRPKIALFLAVLVVTCVPVPCPAQVPPAGEQSISMTNLGTSRLRPPVHPRRNVEDFAAVSAKFVRFRVFKTNVREPCVDELEIYAEGEPTRNLALEVAGAGRDTL